MHIKDGFIDPSIAIVMLVAALILLVISWKKAKATYTQSIAAVLAISSAFVFAAQMINFPIAIGTSGHLVGGTFLAVLLGPFAGMISISLVVIMQMVFFGDGGLSTLGANIFNLALACGLGFVLIKVISRKTQSTAQFASTIFVASWISVMVSALAAGLQVGFSSTIAGGIWAVLPPLLAFYAVAGLIEGAVTSALLVSLKRFSPAIMVGLSLMKKNQGITI